jgi:arylsulfatase A-like enzyme
MISGYYACTSFMDAQVGVLLDTLERSKLADHTIVVMMSDHGFLLGEHGLWQKKMLFEECTRVPLIVSVPGMEHAGAASQRLVEYVDLYPTLVQLCALPVRTDLEGTSFVPLLADPNRPWKRAAFSQVKRQAGDFAGHETQWHRFWHHFIHETKRDVVGRSIETERFHYIEWGGQQVSQLFDLQNDPHEYANLVGQAASAETKETLHRLLQDGWRAARPVR